MLAERRDRLFAEQTSDELFGHLGSARPGTSYRIGAAVSVEPGERMMIHFRYTGRSNYLLDDFMHYGRAEVKYFF